MPPYTDLNVYDVPQKNFTQPLMNQQTSGIQGVKNPSPGQVSARQTRRANNSGGSGMSGEQLGGIVSGVSGLAGVIGEGVSDSKQGLGLDQIQTGPSQINAYDAPVYMGGEASIGAANARPRGNSAGKVLGSAGKGAVAGASIGSVVPVIGTAVGAVGGAIVGTASSLIGGGVKKKRQKRERKRAMGKADAAAQDFNSADQSFRSRQAATEDYNDRTNDQARNYQLYRSNY